MDGDHTPELTFTHARLLVTEYRECFRFYRDVFGFDVEWDDDEGGYADFRTGATTLALFDRAVMAEAVGTEAEPSDTAQQDEVALVFRVESVDDACERLNPDVTFVD